MSETENIPSEQEADALLQTVKALVALVGSDAKDRCHVEMTLDQQQMIWARLKRIEAEQGEEQHPEDRSCDSWALAMESASIYKSIGEPYPLFLWGLRVRTGDTLRVVTRHEGEQH